MQRIIGAVSFSSVTTDENEQSNQSEPPPQLSDDIETQRDSELYLDKELGTVKIPFFSIIYTFILLIYSAVYGYMRRDEIGLYSPILGTEGFHLQLIDTSINVRKHPQFSNDLRHEFWRFATYQFNHLGFLHLTMNVLLFLALAIKLEQVHGSKRIYTIFQLGVLGGGVLSPHIDANVILIGCSGGCYALLGAFLANIVLNWENMPYRWERAGIIGTFVGTEIVQYTAVQAGLMDMKVRASTGAHYGGALTGFLSGMVLLKNLRYKWGERFMILSSQILLFIYYVVCISKLYDNPLTTIYGDEWNIHNPE
jgi:membrane associated rhomboid family serine protease